MHEITWEKKCLEDRQTWSQRTVPSKGHKRQGEPHSPSNSLPLRGGAWLPTKSPGSNNRTQSPGTGNGPKAQGQVTGGTFRPRLRKAGVSAAPLTGPFHTGGRKLPRQQPHGKERKPGDQNTARSLRVALARVAWKQLLPLCHLRPQPQAQDLTAAEGPGQRGSPCPDATPGPET